MIGIDTNPTATPAMGQLKKPKANEKWFTELNIIQVICNLRFAIEKQVGNLISIANRKSYLMVADRAASSYTKEFLFSQSNNDRQLLQMVETALLRIREGAFGECVSCGNEINAKRLEAVPWTRYCIECQEKLEKGQLEEARD